MFCGAYGLDFLDCYLSKLLNLFWQITVVPTMVKQGSWDPENNCFCFLEPALGKDA